jgi:hypothetical protein
MFIKAVTLPKDGLFRRFLEIETKVHDIEEDDAAEYIRAKCEVTTRSEIREGPNPAIEWR